MPAILRGDKLARQEWRRVTKELNDAGVLAKNQGICLAAYCMAYSRWVRAEEDIRLNGGVIETKQGKKKSRKSPPPFSSIST